MKKLILLTLVTLSLGACDREPKSDWQIVDDAFLDVKTENIVFIGDGRGGIIIQTPETRELRDVYDRNDKDCVFIPLWNETREIAEPGTCLINWFAPYEYRLFCGGPADIVDGEFWAVSVSTEPDENDVDTDDEPAE